MSPESLSRLFTPFAQMADGRAHRTGGTGLGLVISQKLVKLMGGKIAAASELHKGSAFTFNIELPVAQMTANTATTPALRVEGLSVLVVEDNAVNQLIIDAMLKQLGHSVTLAADGRRALDALAQQDFDLVLMDCNMPDMDGLEATRRLRAGSAGVRDVNVPVIALTANALDGDRETCLAAGMDDFLPKPVTITALRRAIEHTREQRARSAA
jgi:CheY-like chemotaxis protein